MNKLMISILFTLAANGSQHFDFENGLQGWTADSPALRNQPVPAESILTGPLRGVGSPTGSLA